MVLKKQVVEQYGIVLFMQISKHLNHILHTHLYIYTSICVYYIYLHALTFTYIETCLHVCVFVYIYVYGGGACMCARARVCMVQLGLNQTKFMVVADSRVRATELGRRM